MFKENYRINELVPASYNPRKIKETSFKKLQESLKKFGVVKPVIINKNKILIAGHQRTKAMKSVGIETTPTFIINREISISDEIKFNLMHNSIETETGKLRLKNIAEKPFGYSIINYDEIVVLEKPRGTFLKEIAKLLNKYGEFGSIIVNEKGEVIHNNDYGYICKLFKIKCLIYKMKNETAKEFLDFMKIDYGEYSYETLNIKPYVQTHCQMSRSETNKKSSTYEKVVIPNIKKEERGIDFGAGKCFYANKLKQEGYNILKYEPFFKKIGTEKFDIKSIVKMINEIKEDISRNKLFDYVVLDSVLNSVSSNEYEDAILTTCNALLDNNGTFYTGTRNIDKVRNNLANKKTMSLNRSIEFLDNDNYSACFRKGVWTLQKFHSKESLYKLLSKYFKEVEVFGISGEQIWAKCKKPIRFKINKYEQALEKEFNIEYPNDYRHNKHFELKNAILDCLNLNLTNEQIANFDKNGKF